MATLIPIYSNNETCESDSNASDQYVVKSYVAKCKDLDISGAIFNSEGDLIDIPWLTASNPYVEIIPAEDESAYFKEVYDEARDIVVQDSYFNILGLDKLKKRAATLFRDRCCLVLIHILNTGQAIIQGVDKLFLGEWVLVTTRVNATHNSGTIVTSVGKSIAGSNLVFTSVSRNYALFIENPNPFFDIVEDEEEPCNAPSVANIYSNGVLNPVANGNGQSHVTVISAIYFNNDKENYITADVFPFNYNEAFKNKKANGATSIVISTTAYTKCGMAHSVSFIPITVGAGDYVTEIDGVVVVVIPPTPPTITFILTGKVVTYTTTGTVVSVAATLTLPTGNVTFSGGDFPLDLESILCGYDGLTNQTALTLSGTVFGLDNLSGTGSVSIPIMRALNNKINKINGVSCPLIPENPTITISISGKLVTTVFNDGGSTNIVKTLVVLDGTGQTIATLNPDDTTHDLSFLCWASDTNGNEQPTYKIKGTITTDAGTAEKETGFSVSVTHVDYGQKIFKINGVDCFEGYPYLVVEPFTLNTTLYPYSVELNGWPPECFKLTSVSYEPTMGNNVQLSGSIPLSGVLDAAILCGEVVHYRQEFDGTDYFAYIFINSKLNNIANYPYSNNVLVTTDNDGIAVMINNVPCAGFIPPNISDDSYITGNSLSFIYDYGSVDESDVEFRISYQNGGVSSDFSIDPDYPFNLGLMCGETTAVNPVIVTLTAYFHGVSVSTTVEIPITRDSNNLITHVGGVPC